MLHILDYEDKIIDFISEDDASIINAKHNRDINNRSETFNFTILSERAINMQKNYRVIIQDSTGQYREFIIEHISQDMDGYTEIESTASYLEDITGAPPYAPGSFEKKTTTEALYDVLKDTGWQVSEATEYGGVRTTSWTGFHTRYDILVQLCTTYDMIVDFYIELGSNTVDGRYVVLRKRNPIFQGKEIVKGKDLTGLKRIVDMSEVNTALLCVGPEKEDGSRITLTVKDDEAQAQFGLPGRYIWGIYEPETEDENMTEALLKSLGKTELNKRKKEKISYEVTSLDIKEYQPHEVVYIGDMVRIKDRDFTPPLYLEAEVIAEDYDMITKESTYSFGEYKEYREEDLRQEFYKHLSNIRQRMNDNFSNVNTIVRETNSQLQYFEKKIIKSQDEPENPVNDMLWLDTSNPKVAVLRRYWNGQWINATVEKADDIDAVTREKALYDDLNNTFINLNIQHSKLLSEVHEVIDSEYLVDTALKHQVQQNLDSTINVYNTIKTNLESMTPETATIGKLVDTQSLFLKYRDLLQILYNSLENAKIAIDDRFKLLQSQYTDEKFNKAMIEIASVLPDGHWDSEKGVLTSNIPNEARLLEIQKTLSDKFNHSINDVKSDLLSYTDSELKRTKDEISASIKTVSEKVDGLTIGGRNLLEGSAYIKKAITDTYAGYTQYWATEITSAHKKLMLGDIVTISFDVQMERGEILRVYDSNEHFDYRLENQETFKDIGVEKKRLSFTKRLTAPSRNSTIWLLSFFTNNNGDRFTIENIKIEKGNVATDWSPAPEDVQEQVNHVDIRTIKAENSIKALEDKLLLTATKKDVLRTLSDQLEPIQNEVNEQKSQLQIMSDSIESKVNKTEYTSDVNDIISKLNSAESQREQLSNAINDRVTIKEYTDNKTATTNQINSAVNNLQVGGRNLLENSANIKKAINDTSNNYNQYWATLITSAHSKLQLGETITISFDVQMERGEILRVYDNLTNFDFMFGEKVFKNIGNKKQRLSFTLPLVSTTKTGTLWNLSFYTNNNGDRFTIENIKIEKGNKATDWTPAPEDVKADIDKAKEETDKTLSVMQTQINQNGTDINARATKEEFNASKKTLSNVISDLSINTTTGLTLSYDENGNIQSHTVGPEGIMLKGDRVNINVNKDFQVLAGNVNNKVGKDEIINRLNLSPEGLDINVNNVGIFGGNRTDYVDIRNDKIELSGRYTRTWRGETQNDFVYTRMKDGLLRFRNNTRDRSLYYSDFGISTYVDADSEESSGTLQFFDYTYSPNARGVTLNSANGVVALRTDGNRIVIDADQTVNVESNNYGIYLRPFKHSRPGLNEFYFYVKDNDASSETDGVLMYGNVSDSHGVHGSGIRFSKSRTSNIVYATNQNGDIGTGDFHARNFYGDFQSRSGYLYLKADDRVRITDYKGYNNGNPNYGDLQCRWIQSESIRTTSTNFYIGTSTGEVRITNNLLYNGGNIGYKDIRFKNYVAMSSEKYKYDIRKWDYSVLDVYRNDLQLYSYKNKSEEEEEYVRDHHGIIIEREIPIEWRHGDGFDGNEVLFWNTKAIQELVKKVDELEEQLHGGN